MTLTDGVSGSGGGGDGSTLHFSRAVLDAYEQQIGGRGHRHHTDQILRLRHDKRLLKPLPNGMRRVMMMDDDDDEAVVDARGDRELKFYRDENSGFHCFVPTFFGVASVSQSDRFVPHYQTYTTSKYKLSPMNITNSFILIAKISSSKFILVPD